MSDFVVILVKVTLIYSVFALRNIHKKFFIIVIMWMELVIIWI